MTTNAASDKARDNRGTLLIVLATAGSAVAVLIFQAVASRSLGTDGFGRSDGRNALRKFFEVDRHYITVAALKALADDSVLDQKTVAQAIKKYRIDPRKPDPVTL